MKKVTYEHFFGFAKSAVLIFEQANDYLYDVVLFYWLENNVIMAWYYLIVCSESRLLMLRKSLNPFLMRGCDLGIRLGAK